MLAVAEDGQSIELTGIGAVEHADGLTVVAIPVGHLAIGTSSEELGFIGVVHDRLEHGRFK